MFIVWRGWGVLTVIIPGIVALFILVICESISNELLISQHYWPMSLGLLLSAFLLWKLGKKLNGPGRVFIDKATGQELTFKPNHSLFWIPMQYWSFVIGLVAIAVLFQST